MTTASAIIDRAYILIGYKDPSEPLSSADASYGLGVLNSIVDSWKAQDHFIWAVQETVTSVSGLPITIGPSMAINVERPDGIEPGAFVRIAGVDYPIEFIDREQYAAISVKATTSTIPEYGYYDQGVGTGNIYLYPYPATAVSLHLPLKQTLAEFAALATDYTLANGYRKALEYSLGEELAFGARTLPDAFVRKAQAARRVVRSQNVKIPIINASAPSGSRYARFVAG